MWKDLIESCLLDPVLIISRWHLQIFKSWAYLWLFIQSIYCILQLLEYGELYTGISRHTLLHRSQFPGQQIWPTGESVSGRTYPWRVLRAVAVHFQVILACWARQLWGFASQTWAWIGITWGLIKHDCWAPGGLQSVELPALDFSSGHDLMVRGIEPGIGSVLTARSLLGIPSLPLSLPVSSCSLTHAFSHSLSLLKEKKTKKQNKTVLRSTSRVWPLVGISILTGSLVM